jgi:hypothetical protein
MSRGQSRGRSKASPACPARSANRQAWCVHCKVGFSPCV